MNKANYFIVGERVHDTDVPDNGTVVAVGENWVEVLFDDDTVDNSYFRFDEGVDLNFLAKGEINES